MTSSSHQSSWSDLLVSVGGGRAIHGFNRNLEPVNQIDLSAFPSSDYFDVVQIDEEHFAISAWYGQHRVLAFSIETGTLVRAFAGGQGSTNRIAVINPTKLGSRTCVVATNNSAEVYLWEWLDDIDTECNLWSGVPEFRPSIRVPVIKGKAAGSRSLEMLQQRELIVLGSDAGDLRFIDLHKIEAPISPFSAMSAAEFPSYGAVYGLATREPDTVFVGTYRRHLCCYDVRTMSESIIFPSAKSGTPIQAVLSLEGLDHAVFTLTSSGYVTRFDPRNPADSVFRIRPNADISNWGAIAALDNETAVSVLQSGNPKEGAMAVWSFDGRILSSNNQQGQGLCKMGFPTRLSKCGTVSAFLVEEEEERVRYLIELCLCGVVECLIASSEAGEFMRIPEAFLLSS